MMLNLFMSVLFYFFQLIKLSIWSPGAKILNETLGTNKNQNSAEIHGGSWEGLSVFQHIEESLKSRSHGIAVTCTFQSSKHLDSLAKIGKRWPAIQEPDKNATEHARVAVADKSCNQITIGANAKSTLQNDYLTLTYSKLHLLALQIVAGLIMSGTKTNSTMLLLIPNGSEYTLLLWACILSRNTYISLDSSFLDVAKYSALKHMLQSTKPQIIVVSNATEASLVDAAIAEMQLLHPVLICLSSSGNRNWKSLIELVEGGQDISVSSEAIVDAAKCDYPERIHSIMFTSGTSGSPKGCPMRVSGMSHVLRSQSWLIDPIVGACAVQQPHNSRGIAPAQTLQTWKAGGSVVITGQEFSVTQAAEAIQYLDATFIVLTPPMVHEMAQELAQRTFSVDSVQAVQVGGDTITKGLMIKCAKLFPKARVCVNHGMTEGGGSFIWPFFQTKPEDIPLFGEICPDGQVAPGSVIRVWDEENKCVSQKGELGELHVSCKVCLIIIFLETQRRSFTAIRSGGGSELETLLS